MSGARRAQDQVLQQQAGNARGFNVLEQLQADHEGFSVGPLAALKQSQHVLGSLADKIRVPDQYVTAIETALGHHLQLVLTEQPESARQILADLSANRTGRASIAPLAFVRQRPCRRSGRRDCGSTRDASPAPSRPELNGVPLARMAVVESEASIRPLMERLLGTTRIVRDLNAATAAWRESRALFTTSPWAVSC